VLALHGADDPFVSAADLAAFEQEMRSNGVDWQLVKYGGAVHSFTIVGAGNDNSKGAAYNATADAGAGRRWRTSSRSSSRRASGLAGPAAGTGGPIPRRRGAPLLPPPRGVPPSRVACGSGAPGARATRRGRAVSVGPVKGWSIRLLMRQSCPMFS